MSERQLIEIDYCPDCKGVWLDRGELDKIIDCSLTRNPRLLSIRGSRSCSRSRRTIPLRIIVTAAVVLAYYPRAEPPSRIVLGRLSD
ncbi:zf-TFIIB domain-containing protein [Agrobacterium tumefaciens]|uniref:TFIIB-type zinc ribbon-containing protein n=1 Tax=Agrobacterium tumefaciens TaxID=358 RepID=UPI001F4139A4